MHVGIGINNTNVGAVNTLSPVRRPTIIYTNTALLSIGPLATNFRGIQLKMQDFSLKKLM